MERVRRVGGLQAGIKGIRNLLGERDARRAWEVFGKQALLYGVEVWVWDRGGVRARMERVEKKALRMVFALDKGVNDGVLYGEGVELKVTSEGDLRALRYGEKMGGMERGTLGRDAWEVRKGSGGDRWAGEDRRVRRKLEGLREGEERESWRELMGKAEQEEWGGKLRSSVRSLEVYREVVKVRGEMQGWGWLEGKIRTWFRKFLGGVVVGRNRGNGWKVKECEWCGWKEGCIRHFVEECEDGRVKELRRKVVEDVEREVYLRKGDVMGWEALTEKERVWRTLGKGWRETGEAWRQGPRSWWTHWKWGGWEGGEGWESEEVELGELSDELEQLEWGEEESEWEGIEEEEEGRAVGRGGREEGRGVWVEGRGGACPSTCRGCEECGGWEEGRG